MPVGLYEHQRRAVESLRSGSVLCGGVGTGKSLTALAYFYVKVCGGKLETQTTLGEPMKRYIPLYIITTARKRDSHEWESECSKIGIDPSTVVIDSWNNVKKYDGVKDSFFIFDEQRVVGKGAWVKAFLRIAKSNRWILLTATPGDSWIDYVPIFIANGFYRNRTEFIRRHVVYAPMSKYPKIVRYLGTRYLEELRSKVVIEMDYQKEAVQHDRYLKVSYDEELYRKVSEQYWNPYEEKPIENVSQYCYIQRRVVNESPDRWTALKNVLSVHHRVIVFYNFDYELMELRSRAEEYGIRYKEWNGHKHEDVPTGTSWLYFVQYAAGAEAWNCIVTNTMLFYSATYSYKTLKQARGRIDRLNTPFTDLYYYYLYSSAPIDKAIRSSLAAKKDFNEKTFALARTSQLIMEGTG